MTCVVVRSFKISKTARGNVWSKNTMEYISFHDEDLAEFTEALCFYINKWLECNNENE